MKFILMTSQGVENNFADELVKSKLFPAMIVTDNPFYCGKINPLKFIIKKGLLILRFLIRYSEIKRRYQAYFIAKRCSIPIWPSEKVNNDEFAVLIKEMGIDYGFIFAFRKIKEKIFTAPKYGCINFHPSLLPFNRGASPFNWIILNDRRKTGITFHFVTNVIDGGSIIEQYEIPLSGYETAEILNGYLFGIGAILFVRLIIRLKHKYRYNLTENDIANGSYEPPFGKDCSIISAKNTYHEISSIIRSSRFNKNYAVYVYSGKVFMVLNCIDLTDFNLSVKEYPFLDEADNIYLKSADNKIVYLLIMNSPADNLFSRSYKALARSFGPYIIFMSLRFLIK
jgi:methionyl-tRNA formyltransferase